MEMSAIVVVGLFCVLISSSIQIEASQNEDQSFQSRSVLLPEIQQYRTSYHFQPPKNWLNDPNGPMWYNGVYHLFYQYNPYGALFGDRMVWAHSVSYDLINWIHLDHALQPTEPFDINSCWSGSVTILPENKPTILYTGIDANKRQVQNLAMPKNESDPFLEGWIKYPQNPLIVPPNGVEPDNFRDPTTAWFGPDGKWNVVVGSWSNGQGMAILYQSEDFIKWSQFESSLYSTNRTGMWECPDFYPVSIDSKNGLDTSVHNPGVKHVMKASFNSHDYYMIGTYVSGTEKYIPDADFTGTSVDLRYDYGKFYASKTFFDSVKKRRILWGWVNESDSREDDVGKGWSGLQSIPREIWLDKSGKQLVQWPVEEINLLHGNEVSFLDRNLDSGTVLEVKGITASQADVEVMFDLPGLLEAEFLETTGVDAQLLCADSNASVNGRLGPFGLLALASKDLTEQTAIFFRIFKGRNGYAVLMCSDQSRSSLRGEVDKTTYGAFVNIDPQQEKISLRSLIDHSIVESFGGEGRTCITSRVYPQLAVHEETRLYLFNNGTRNVRISRLNAWSMNRAQIKHKESHASRASQ